MFGRIAIPLLVIGCLVSQLPAQENAAAASGGTLKIADQEYKLTHVVAYEAISFDEKVVNVLLSVKPIDKAKLKEKLEKEGNDDSFFFFEPQVKVKFDKDGKASYTFAYADGTSINVGGGRLTGEAVVKDGKVTGQAKLSLDPEDKGQFRSQFEIKFNEPLLAAKLPSGKPDDDSPDEDKPAAKTAKAKSKARKAASDDDEPAPETPEDAAALAKKLLAEALGDDGDAPKGKGKSAKAAGDVVSVKDLPLPEGASDVAYKKLVGQITFKAESRVKETAETFAAGLKKQGWKESGTDLVTGQSAILNRKLGKAELTIFVKPSGEGSTVTIMIKGLSWDEK